MARIAGVNLPTNKRVIIALQYIHGIGPKGAADIMEKTGFDMTRRVNQLTDAEVLQIREIIDRDFMVVTVVVFLCVVSVQARTHVHAKAQLRQLQVKRNN